MRNMLIVFFIICFVLILIVFPFKVRLMGHVNLINLKCYYSLKVWIIKLLCGRIIVQNGKINMLNDDTILSKSYNNEFVKVIGKNIVDEIDVKKVEIFFTGGLKQDSFSSAMICGVAISLVESIFGYLSLNFENVKMYEDIKPTFEEDNLELTLDVVVSISIWKVLKSVLKAGKMVKNLKGLKNEG